MKRKLNLQDFRPEGCSIMEHAGEDMLLVACEEEGGRLFLEGKPEQLGGAAWSETDYLVFDAVNHTDWIMGVTLEFWEKDNDGEQPNMHITMGLIPGVKTRLSLPLKALDSQVMFLPRTPGKLKTVVFGNKVDLKAVNRLAIGTMKCFDVQKLEIANLHLSDVEPEYPLPDRKLVDELGQFTIKDWPGKTHDEGELTAYLQEEAAKLDDIPFFAGWSRFGGWADNKLEATGYFRTHHDGQRWWLVDPEGCLFFSAGLDCVRPEIEGRVDGIEKFHTWLPDAEGPFQPAWSTSEGGRGTYFDYSVANLIRGFGESWQDQWYRLTRRRMVEWGFNTVGNWSSRGFTQYGRIPYVWPLSDFPDTREKVFRDFPDVFSEEYAENARRFARQLESFVGDPYLIGYFLRNEPQWAFVAGLNIAEELLENEADLASKDALIAFLSEKYGTLEAFNRAWGIQLTAFSGLKKKIKKAAGLSAAVAADLEQFSRVMIARYVALPSEAAKAVDPHHMNLGMRYAYITNEMLLSGCEHFDVFSLNCYKMNPYQEVQNVGELTGLPVMIGEYHFGALDRGLISNSLRGVTSQKERGNAYRYYLENAASSSYCVGAHYFTLYDQAALGRFDGENFQIGVLDICHRPYDEFVEGIVTSHRQIYEIAAGRTVPYDKPPEEVPRTGF